MHMATTLVSLALYTADKAILDQLEVFLALLDQQIMVVYNSSDSTQILLASLITSDGYFPMAVSAENIIASIPDVTALATSKTSARVELYYLSSIPSFVWLR